MKRLVFLVSVFVLAVLLVPATGFAGDYFLTPKIGTQGVGGDVGKKITPKLGVRGNLNYFTYSHDDTIEDVEYDADLDLTTVGALVDFHPFENGFRLSAGAYYNGNEVDLDGKLSEGISYDIGDHTYTSDELGSMKGNVEYDSFAPYLGIGWGTSTSSGSWAFSMDLGAMYQGSPDVSLSAANQDQFEKANNNTDRDLNKDIEREIGNVEDDMDYEWYPVVSVGVTYKF